MSSARSAGLFAVDLTKPIVLVVTGQLTPADVPPLCAELTEGAGVVVDVGGLTHPDLTAVDALARLTLAARRRGCRLRLRGTGRELRLLLDGVGLAETIPEEARGSGTGGP
ncbi:STAS domain-containing protein [Streptomyces sp. NPDC051569]|uniref:STAS domain-containing protein n=1 Tax=Streptomyces sp. NPDC051569 TaxID=3365661 RepID=UPI0037A52F66